MSPCRVASCVLTAAALSAFATAAPPEPGFWLMGAPLGSSTVVTSLTKDGGTAAGGAPSFTWTLVGGRVDFGALPGAPFSNSARGLSDNAVVTGSMSSDGFPNTTRAYRWTGSGAFQDLGLPPLTSRSYGTGVSGDGNVVVGFGESGSMGGFTGQAFRWTPTGGMQGLGFLKPLSVRSQANGVSRDGTAIVGRNMDFNLTDEAFVWTEASGMKALPNLPNAPLSAEARAVNADGSVVVGDSASLTGFNHAVRWTSSGVEDLVSGSYANVHSTAFATSDDGLLVGGTIQTDPANLAFLWTPKTEMILAIDYLAMHGIAVPSGYELEHVYAISGDGMTFGGRAWNLASGQREGFVATIPTPATCLVLAPLIMGASRRRRA